MASKTKKKTPAKPKKVRADALRLSSRQQTFIRAIIAGKSRQEAAVEAGCPPGASADVQASKWLKYPKIAEAVKSAEREALEGAIDIAKIDKAEVLKELKRRAFMDPGLLFDDDGKPLPIKSIPAEARRTISGFEYKALTFKGREIGHVKKIKQQDSQKALEMLAKYFKLLTDVVENTGPNGGPQVILVMPANGSEKKEDGNA